MRKLSTLVLLAFTVAILIFTACSKGGGGTTPPPNPCAGVTITVTGSTTPTSTATATNGAINATASGSTGLTYSLNGGVAQSTGSFSNLGVGSYTVTAKNANGCSGTATFNVTSTPCPTITVTGTTTQASSTTSANGAINATASGSTGFTYSRDGVTFQASGAFTGLLAGSYTITAKDVNGCTGTANFTVTAASCPTITLTATPTNTTGPTATNGSISASATGGATPYTFSRDGGAFQTNNVFSNLAVGTYSIVAKDANGCLSPASNVTVGATCPTITPSVTITNTIKCEAANGGAIAISVVGGVAPLTYSKDGGATFQTSNIFTLLTVGNYSYVVKDANGCTTTPNNATVAQAPAGTLFSQVKTILANNCVSCHGGPFPQNGLNFTDDCTIVGQAARIKARAVDFSPSQMPPAGPPISATDRQTIINWINAGAKHNN
jgi:hypothetical protein